jgi:hypothetical protein
MSKQRKRLEEMIEEEEGVIEGHPSGTPIVCYEHYEGMKNKRKGSRFITSRMASLSFDERGDCVQGR